MDNNYSVYYIKLGTGNEIDIANKCIAENMLWFSYKEVPEETIREAIETGIWSNVASVYNNKAKQVQTSYCNTIKKFYKASENDYFFTFIGSIMYYCQPKGSIIPIDNNTIYDFEIGTRIRKTAGWKCTPLNDSSIILREHILSGKLTQAKMYRGTLFELDKREKQIFINTINWKFEEYNNLLKLKREMHELVLHQIKELNPHDFEVLVDLLLTKSGWERIGEMGGTIKAIDMEYYIPVENQRVYVQVKSELKSAQYKEAISKLQEYLGYDTPAICYFAFHSGGTLPKSDTGKITIKELNGTVLATLCCNHQESVDWLFKRTTGRN